MEFERIRRLPPYILGVVTGLMQEARRQGEDIINLGMGNPDGETPPHIVEKLVEAAPLAKNHRYSVSRGIPNLRRAICQWYRRRFHVELDPDSEAIATMGAKEGISHLILAITAPGDTVLVPNPSYPIHAYAAVIAGADIRWVKIQEIDNFFEQVEKVIRNTLPRPKYLLLSFPSNPTTQVVDLPFFEKVVALAREHNLKVIHDFAYADLVFDGYVAPSLLSVPGAREVAVEIFSLSKSYNMPGWRVGFIVGNREMIAAVTRLKSYFDYGMFQPVQIASIIALNGPQECVHQIAETYRRRRDALCDGLAKVGWAIPKPQATMFVWARLPDEYQKMGSVEFCKLIMQKGKVALSPGVGFGEYGEGYVRFALVENEKRIHQAVAGIKKVL